MTSARELSVEQQPHARVFRRASPPARLNLPPFASPTVVVTPPPMPGAEKGYMEAGGHGSGAGTPGSGYEPHRDEARKELGHVHEVDDSLPTEYLGRILAFQLVFRTVAAAVYLAGTLEWYTYHRWPSMLAYWTYWIPAHYAAMNALRTGRRRAWTALGFALLSHAIEGFVLINVVYNPEVWGARKLRYLVLPTAIQGLASFFMTVGACAVWFVHAQRGEKRITAEAITAPALPAADLAFLIGLLLVPYVPYTSDTPTHRVVAVTTVLSVLALMLRHMSFTRAFTGIPYLPDHTLFAAISLSDSWQKGKELSRKMGIPIPGLADDEPFRQVVETDMGFLQRVYLLHFFRLAVTTLAWDAALTHMSITDVVAHHPWLALIGGLALYRAPTFLAGLRQSPLSVTAPAVIAIDVLRGVMLASAGGVVRSLINIFGFGVSDSEKDHVVTHAHLIVLLGIFALLGARAALPLTFFTSSPRDRSARGGAIALVLAGSATTYMAQRLNLVFSLSGLLPYSYTHDVPATISSVVLFAVLAAGAIAGAYACSLEVWRANSDGSAVARLPADEVLLGALVLDGGRGSYDRIRRAAGGAARDLPALPATPLKEPFSSHV